MSRAGLSLGVLGGIVLLLAATVDARAPRPAATRTASAAVPLVKQALRNNCETAALSMLLAWRSVRVDQLTLQRNLVRSGPLDPKPSPLGGLPTWGNPDKGFVGRAEGGGAAGGFGVYQGPVRRLAARYGIRLVDLSRSDPVALYRRLARGIPVLVWIGLSEGPYRRWLTPTGRLIVANMGEHAIVLTGRRDGLLVANDPLYGVRTTFSHARFEELWSRLGRRALSYPMS